MSDNKQHGGRRAGAGRPPKGDTKMDRKVSVMLTPEQAAYLEHIGGGNMSEGLRIVIAAHREQQEPNE